MSPTSCQLLYPAVKAEHYADPSDTSSPARKHLNPSVHPRQRKAILLTKDCATKDCASFDPNSLAAIDLPLPHNALQASASAVSFQM